MKYEGGRISRIDNMVRSAAGCVLLLLLAFTPHHPDTRKALPKKVELSERLKPLFARTKQVCFGRYVLEVPQEAKLIWGGTGVSDGGITFIRGGPDASAARVASDIDQIKKKSRTAEITYNKEGPVDASWQLRYFESESAKEFKVHLINTYVNKGDITFLLRGSVPHGAAEAAGAAKEASLVKNLRLRRDDEIPAEPGYCIPHGFLADNLYAGQETVNVGIYLPSLPDITFSISSNKDAYGDYPPAEFEAEKRKELSLLARINAAKGEQGFSYPSRTVLREGKRDVQHWYGEESLVKRKDGTHDFEWAFVGTPRDVANPSEYNARMFSKVKHNVVGVADNASLTDAEALALWDKLLSTLKFRVKVPRAPEGSYLMSPSSEAPKPSAQ